MRDYVVSPESILRRCVANGLITFDEATSPVFQKAAQEAADDLRDSWSPGEGFGSSDFTFLAQDFLRIAGLKADFVDGRLTRVTS